MSATPQPAQLTAAEALVLQNPQLAQGRAALKVTMMEMLARRILTMRHDERKGMFGRNQRTDYLVLASNAAQLTPQAAHIRAVVNMLRAADASGQGAAMTTVLAQARKTFGADLSAFQNKHVLPMLIERGLVEPYQAKRLGIFSTTKYRPTTQGDIVRQQLAMHLEQARALPNVIERDPMQAAVLVATLGSSVLLVDELKPFYSRLSQAMRPAAANDAGGDVLVVDNDDNIEDSSTLDSHDFGGFDFDFDAFDSLDSSLDAFDSSFDSSSDSGSDGGGDGGGGSD